MILARGLRKSWGATAAVDGLALEVGRGEIFGLVGPDGAGKTTAIRLLCGILDADRGSASVAGFDVRAAPEEVKRRIGYMSQRFSLYGDLTVAENLRFFAELHHVPRKERREREAGLLEFSRLAPYRDRLAQNLSGGMKQKLALACTLVHEPAVVLLDEPTTGVDPVSRREFWRLLSEFLSQGITIFMATPYLDEAERCSRIALMSNGHVLAVDRPSQMRASFPDEIVEVLATPPGQAEACVRGVPGVHDVQAFGERLHVRVARGASDRTLRDVSAAFAQAGVQVTSLRVVPASLEDVFIDRVVTTRATGAV